MICNNCSENFEGNYCPNCGQRPNSGRIILRESVQEILQHYFDLDAPLFRTIKQMVTNPGKMIRDYIFGKRKSYSHPFRFFILTLAVYLIYSKLLDFNAIETFSEMVGARELPNPNSTGTIASEFMREHINYFLIFFGFTLSFFSRIFFRKSGFYFVEYLSLSFFVIGEYLFFDLFVMTLSVINPFFFLLNYMIVLFYPAYVLVRFHEGKIFGRIFKAFFSSILGWFFYGMISYMISYFIVKFF